MNRAYWMQKANPWVSAAVLVGGLVSAVLLVFIQRVQSDSLMLTGTSALVETSGSGSSLLQ